jgi:DNA-binding NarL/FixJ family response regulator
VPASKILKLLIVEDSLEDEELLCDALLEIEENRLGSNWQSSNIVPVDGLSDALDCLRRDSFDAILLNLSLPDSPALLDTFLDVSACAEGTPILILADEPDENLANRLLRDGAQDVLVKSEIECAPLARAIRYAIERERRIQAQRTAAFVDELTGVLSRDAFLKVAEHLGPRQLLASVEIVADRDALDPLLIQAAEVLLATFEPPSVVGRWDRHRFCVMVAGLNETIFEARLNQARLNQARLNQARLNQARLNQARLNQARLNQARLNQARLDCASARLSDAMRFSIVPFHPGLSLEEALASDLRPRAKTAILAD